MTSVSREVWLKDMPERILFLLLLKKELSTEELMRDFGKEDLIRGSLSWLIRQGFITNNYICEEGGAKVTYKLTGTGIEELQKLINDARA